MRVRIKVVTLGDGAVDHETCTQRMPDHAACGAINHYCDHEGTCVWRTLLQYLLVHFVFRSHSIDKVADSMITFIFYYIQFRPVCIPISLTLGKIIL